jgi:hypothetical protein
VIDVHRPHDHQAGGTGGFHGGTRPGLTFLVRRIDRRQRVHGDSLSTKRGDFTRQRVFGAPSRRRILDHHGRDHLGAAYLHGPRVGVLVGGLEDVLGRLRRTTGCAAGEREQQGSGCQGRDVAQFHGAMTACSLPAVCGTFVLERTL